MNVISFNILYKDKDRKVILTETPYLFVNDEVRPIITEIRRIIKEDFNKISEDMSIPIAGMCLGMTVLANNNMHFFEVDIINVSALKK